jgi:excisionase family DNA binding protein
MASQLYLFESVAHDAGDGSFIVRPKRMIDGREITAKRAADLLGFRDRETIFRLVESGQIKGWKPKSKRGNGKYRIDLGSVMDYKESRLREARGA